MATVKKTPSVTFAPKAVSERPSSRTLRSNSTNASSRRSSRISREIETPHGSVLRESISNLRSANSSPNPTNMNEPDRQHGWRDYACLFACWLLQFHSWGVVNSYGTYSSYYSQHLMPDEPIVQFNVIGATQSFVILALSFVTGRLLDAGHSLKLLIVGALLIATGSFSQPFVNGDAGKNSGNYGLILLTQGIICALGQACFFVAASQIASTRFPKRRGLVIGVVASGASIGGTVYPMMLKFLISSHGLILAQVYVATLQTGLSFIAVCFARPHPRHKIRKPEKWMAVATFIDREAFRNPSYVWFCAAVFFLFFGFYPVFFNLEEWAAKNGLGYKDETPGPVASVTVPGQRLLEKDAIRTFWLTCICNGSSAVGRIVFAALCDYCCGALNVHAAVTGVASMLLLLFWPFIENVPAAICFNVFYGLLSGAVIGLPPASISYILGDQQQDRFGQWMGMTYAIAAPASFLGPVLAGLVVTKTNNNFLTVQLWCGVCILFCFVCMVLASWHLSKQRAVPSMVVDHVATKSSGTSSTNVAEKESV
ncbi:MFS general substrate transporter [Acrodontium crateriforme]|uniref:MFS general substrate transporter n=1 Tax=Acrodontium crateriforme TaxID=150365 RepID=A0AAQ3R258_9PEZI|nr:MFS general substrate transporter [Acrodontium crateriforme]